MATKSTSPAANSNPDSKTASQVDEWKTWRMELKKYWPQVDKMDEMYQFYKREASETSSDVSLNTPFALIEGYIARLNDTNMEVNADAEGENDLSVWEEYVGSLIHDAIFDPQIEALNGAFRKVKEVWERDFLAKGNAVAELNYMYTTRMLNGQKKVIANNPYVKNLPLKSVVFNPSKTLATSNVYYVEKWVTMDDLKNAEVDPATKKGIYTNLGALQISLTQDDKLKDNTEDRFIVGGQLFSRKVAPIHLLERWEGPKLTVIANEHYVIREAYDPLKMGTHPLILGMNYVVEGRPYAYGEIDAIYKTVRAQDAVVNQKIETINQYLRQGVLIEPSSGMDLDMVMTIMENGGAGYGNPQAIANIPKLQPPAGAFQETEELQTIIERTARFSPYAQGTPNQVSDKTQGTKGGTLAIQQAAEPNFQVKLDAVTDQFLSPIARKMLPMIANLMGDDEVRFALLKGENPQWVKASKGILMGQATLQDMLMIGLITQQQFTDLTRTPDGRKIPGSDKAYLFDVNWIIRVHLDPKSQADKQAITQNMMQWVQQGVEMGLPLNTQKAWTSIGKRMDIDNAADLFFTEQEIAQQKEQAAAGQTQDGERKYITINFKDLPPEGQVQAGAQYGIKLDTGMLAQHQLNTQLMQEHSNVAADLRSYKPQPLPTPPDPTLQRKNG